MATDSDTRPDSVGQAHTPTPWRVDPHYAADVQTESGSLEIATTHPKVLCGGDDTPDFNEAYANARFIVHAVNCHDELLEALIGVRRVGDDKLAFRSEWAAAVRKADAAIAKGKGGQP